MTHVCQYGPVTLNRIGSVKLWNTAQQVRCMKRPRSQPMHDDVLLIRRRRIEAGLTQEELAEILDVSAVTVGRWETGNRKVTIETLSLIASALNVPIAALIRDSDGLSDEERDLIATVRESRTNAHIIFSTVRGLQEAQRGFEHESSSHDSS